ncbi:MAG: hypothetical protein JW919_06205 [Candidatus Omnitrophica bacterium]|nr:hypothetical protein [Candidatus Omnitrophota bacterium]
MKNQCLNCPERKRCRDSAASWVYFVIGLIAAFSVRLVAVFMDYNVLYAKMAWYVGVIGFFIFFLYKFHIDTVRARLIKSAGITARLRRKEPLSGGDYDLLSSILCALSSNKDRINYFVIFSTSILTVAFAVYADFFRR